MSVYVRHSLFFGPNPFVVFLLVELVQLNLVIEATDAPLALIDDIFQRLILQSQLVLRHAPGNGRRNSS